MLAAVVASPELYAQGSSHARPRVTQGIDETNRVALRGNTRPAATSGNDRGAVRQDLAMEHMLLQLKRSPEEEQAVQQFIDELHDPHSPNFHHWVSAEEFGERFGLAKSDLDTLSGWLRAHGFRVNVVYPSGMLIDFSGTAGQVRSAFQTEIHELRVNGEKHIGNVSDPRIPAALAPVVAGVVSLHDFRPRAMHKMRKPGAQFTFPDQFGGTSYAVVPADLATIYNLNPLFSAGISGQGQTIVLIEDTDVFSAADWSAFRQNLGLSGYTSATFAQVHPPAPSGQFNNCGAPGVVPPNDAEAILDAEWASASAPSAGIEMAACADTATTFGGLIAIQNLINAATPPPSIMSISYGECETMNGAASNAAYNAAYQQAVAEGVSVFVAAGDSGAAACDNSVSEATHGIAANAFASTPNNVAVGGTDFSDTYSGTNDTYWNSSNTSVFGSALSYIPEIPWNDSCAGALLNAYEGYSPTYGSTSLCNDPFFGSLLASTVAGGGAPSQCASGAPSTPGVVSGSCQGWAKPSWQSVVGNPNDGVRDTPDVSLFAADGLWSHFYVFCWSDTANGGAACGADPSAWSGAGGTSFASPIMAGIQALINQKAGGPQGNPAPGYYQLAAAEYGSSGNSSCNSNNGNAVASSCIFYDVTMGDMDVDCNGPNCYLGDGTLGVLSTSNTSFAPAYGTNVGWDFATGIGTVNAANLVNNWQNSTQPNFSLLASPATLSLVQGSSISTTININVVNGFSGNVTLAASGLPNGVTASFSPNPATTSSTMTLSASSTPTFGSATVTVTGMSGSLTNSTPLTVSVNPQGNFTLAASPNSLTLVQGTSGSSTISVNAQGGFNGTVSLTASGLPSGVTASFSPSNTSSPSTVTLSASSTATTGAATVTITGTVGNLSNITTISLTVNPGPNYTLSASPSSLTIMQGSSGTSTITVNPQFGFSSSVGLSASGLPSGVTGSFSPNSTTSTSTLTLTASSTATTGRATVTITGTSGALSKTATISLTIRAFSTLPSAWTDDDIGATGVVGAASFGTGTFTVSGAGAGTFSTNSDGFHFVYQPLTGDGSIVARVASVQGSSAQAGIMIRETLDPAASNIFLFAYGTGLWMTERSGTGAGGSYQSLGNATVPAWIKLTRSGNVFAMYSSADGANWTQLGSNQTISMAQSVYLGLAVSSRSISSTATGTFDGVSVSSSSSPAPVITGVSASSASIGSQVVISGSGFGATQGGSVVLLNGMAASVNAWSATSITMTIPTGATSGALLVSVAPSMNDSNAVRFTVTSQPLPPNWFDQDLGSVGLAGSATYSNGVFTVQGAGLGTFSTNIDAFHFAYQALTGDGVIVARVVSVQGSSAQAGVMIRETLNPGASHMYLFSYGSGLWMTERTSTSGYDSYQSLGGATLPSWIKLTRIANVFTMYSSSDGVNWNQLGSSQTVSMATSVYAGLAVSSRNTSALATATFDNVSIGAPPPPSPTFSLSASPSSLSIAQGGSGTTTVTVTPQNGFSGNVNLTASGLPSGVTASFNPNSTASTSTLTLTTSSTAATGTANVTVTGTSGAITRTTTMSLTIRAVSTLPSVWADNDIGSTGVVGSASYTSGAFTVSGAGSGTFSTNADSLHFVYQPLSGDGYIVARVGSVQGSSAQAGVMIRETLNPGASNIFLFMYGSGLWMTERTSANAYDSYQSLGSAAVPAWIKLARSGNVFTMYSSSDGANWTQLSSSQTISMAQSAHVGLAVSSRSTASAAMGTFDGVSISSASAPAPAISSLSAYSASMGSQVVIAGSGFGPTQGGSLALLNGAAVTVNSWSDTSITITIPTGATSGPLLVAVAPNMNDSNAVRLTVSAQPLPASWLDLDVGSVGLAGNAAYNNGVFTIQGAGLGTFSTNADSFHLAYQTLSGDATIIARVASVQGSSTQAGIMIRETPSSGASHVYLFDYGSGLWMTERNGTGAYDSYQSLGSVTLSYWIKLVRSGNVFTMFSSANGTSWTPLGSSQTLAMAPSVDVGLAVSSRSTTSLATATFDNVSVTSP